MPNRTRSVVKALALLLLCAAAIAADGPAQRWDCGPAPEAAPSQAQGRLLILPGVGNTRFHLAGFVAAAEAQLPRFDVEVRPWGVPFMTIHNLRAHERNTATAAAIAAEIATWRRANPDAPFYLVGYSGGGGMATLVTAALARRRRHRSARARRARDLTGLSARRPTSCRTCASTSSTTRASAICRSGGARARSARSIARTRASAGAIGFAAAHERLLEYHWSAADAPFGHAGNHLAYLSGRWQAAKLLPALDPLVGAEALRARWARTCKES